MWVRRSRYQDHHRQADLCSICARYASCCVVRICEASCLLTRVRADPPSGTFLSRRGAGGGRNLCDSLIHVYALKLQINDQAPVIGGADDLAVLNAIVGCVGRLGPATVTHRDDETEDFYVTLGGLTSRPVGVTDEHLYWLSQAPIKPGDRIVIELIETGTADAIARGDDAMKHHDGEREYFEHCKQVYLEMRSKYESEA